MSLFFLRQVSFIMSVYPYPTLHGAYPATFQSSSSHISELNTKPVCPIPCLRCTPASITHLPPIPYFDFTLLQLSLGFVFFLSPLSSPGAHDRAISKQHCWGTCKSLLLLSSPDSWPLPRPGRGPRTLWTQRACTWTEALYPPSQPCLHLLHTELMSELQRTSSTRLTSD